MRMACFQFDREQAARAELVRQAEERAAAAKEAALIEKRRLHAEKIRAADRLAGRAPPPREYNTKPELCAVCSSTPAHCVCRVVSVRPPGTQSQRTSSYKTTRVVC